MARVHYREVIIRQEAIERLVMQWDGRLLEGSQVLLVEDCPDQARLYYNILKRAGAEVTLECNGPAAITQVRRAPDAFSAIVMDFQLGEMDGIVATQEIRKLGFSGAIIAFTAYDSLELREHWRAMGCSEYLKKPVHSHVLTDVVARSIRASGRQTATT